MTSASLPAPEPAASGLARLVVSEPLPIAAELALHLLGEGAGSWLGGAEERMTERTERPRRRFATDLKLRVAARPQRLTFRKAAFVDLGEPLRVDGGAQVGCEWRASSLAPLFPVFSGTLTLTGRDAAIEGFYAPPGGAIGLLADRALLHLAAVGTARWLIGELRRATGT